MPHRRQDVRGTVPERELLAHNLWSDSIMQVFMLNWCCSVYIVVSCFTEFGRELEPWVAREMELHPARLISMSKKVVIDAHQYDTQLPGHP